MLHRAASETLTAWMPPDDEQASTRLELLAHLATHPDAMWRSCAAGHLTGSAIVVSSDWQQVALVFHPRIDKWVQPGGHCEPGDSSLAAVALREATEETGIVGLSVADTILEVDIHPFSCPKGTDNRHLDVRYVCVAPAGAQPVCSHESDDVRWFDIGSLPSPIAPSAQRAIERLPQRERRG